MGEEHTGRAGGNMLFVFATPRLQQTLYTYTHEHEQHEQTPNVLKLFFRREQRVLFILRIAFAHSPGRPAAEWPTYQRH